MPVVTLPDGSSRSYDNPVTIADVAADIGDRITPGAPLLSVNQSALVTAGPATADGGEIEVFVTDGQEIASGDVILAIDDVPVTAIAADVEFDRDLSDGVDPGHDVLAV